MWWQIAACGALSALLVDAKEFYDCKKRDPAAAYNWQIAGARILIGLIPGLMIGLGGEAQAVL